MEGSAAARLKCLAAAGAAVLALAAAACREGGPTPRARAEEALLKRQVEGLRSLIEAAERKQLFSADHLAIGVEEALVRELLAATLPQEKTIAGRARVRLEKADVSFRSVQSVVTVSGRVSSQSEPSTFADLTLTGGLDRIEVNPQTGKLVARVVLDDFEVQRAAAGGAESGFVRSAVESLGQQGLESLSELVPPIEIPVRLEQQIEMGGLGEGPVSVMPARLPLTAVVAQVLPLSGRLWVMIEVTAGPWQKREPAPAPAPGGRP